MNSIPIIFKDNSLTPFIFYTEFLDKVADFYRNSNNEVVEFKLIEGDDFDFTQKQYYIDPISMPLLLTLFRQLSKFHKKPINLHLTNTPITINILEYLHNSDFFNVSGNNKNPMFPQGRNILKFNEVYLGNFSGNKIRSDHKLRCYSLYDDSLIEQIKTFNDETSQRDYLVEYYTYKVKEHFYNLIFENENTQHLTNEFIEILAELITNGVLHSKSEAFVLMFSDRFKTKFSISDNGIGLFESLKAKEESSQFYKKFSIFEQLSKSFPLQVDETIKKSVLILFETLFYSMLKDRQGLFDLMCNVVLNCSGYFRLHTDNAQIIVSARMMNELSDLYSTRNQMLNTYNSKLFELIDQKEFEVKMTKLVSLCEKQILSLASTIFKKYSEDIRFSALRIFEVRFRGVHLEVEIPNSNNEL